MSIEIIPNWHPIFVHFTVALFSIAVCFALLAYITKYIWLPRNLSVEFEIVMRWCLWTVALITIGTILAGFYAYNTVKHDTISHAAMMNHRNWALPTAAAIFLLACWSVWRYIKNERISLMFIIALLVVEGLLLSTAWRGGELVYRHGLGVMSLPQPAKELEHHHHSDQKHEMK